MENISNGDAVITMKITEKNGQYILSDKGFISATFIDLSKITNYDEKIIITELIRNTLQKMQLSKLQKELESTKTKATKMKTGIKKITDAADKTKSGIGSRNVNALKRVIRDITENEK